MINVLMKAIERKDGFCIFIQMKFVFSTLLLLTSFNSFCQRDRFKNDSVAILNLPVKNLYLRPQALSDNIDSVPFNKITCYDVRQDTSCLGVIETNLKRRVVLAPTTSGAIDSYLNTRFAGKTKATGNLHLYVKKLRLMLYDSIPKTLEAPFQSYKLAVVVECYLEFDDRYYPAFRIDTSFISRKEDVETTGSALIPFMNLLSEKCISLNQTRILKRNSYKAIELKDRYSPKQYPKPARGLYESIEAFQKSKPSVVQFKANYKDNHFDFVADKDSINYHSKVFIYCDGNNAWIFAGGQFCPLIRKGDRFEFYQYEWKYSTATPVNLNNMRGASPVSTAATTGVALGTDLLLSGNYVSKRKYHYLDIETGEIY